jgi:hypothetical protein
LTPISKLVYDEMLELGLLKPEIVMDCDGKPIIIKNKETGKYERIVNKKCQVTNKNKNSNAKSYYVETPIYLEYLRVIG